MEEEDWLSRYMKPFDPTSEGTEEDGNKEEETAGGEELKGTGEEEQEEHEEDWFDKYMKPFNPDEEEAAGEREGEPEEARKAKGTRAPTKPSKEEVDEHMLTHLPFRSWCPHCVRGNQRGNRTRRQRTSRGNCQPWR